MNIKEKIAVAVILVIALASFVISLLNQNKIPVVIGNIAKNDNAYSTGVSYSTSSIGTNTATSLLVRATSSRTFAEICNLSANIVYLFKQSTSTGVVTSFGHPLYASSSYADSCVRYDDIDPYMGQVFGIAGATSTVSIESLQN